MNLRPKDSERLANRTSQTSQDVVEQVAKAALPNKQVEAAIRRKTFPTRDGAFRAQFEGAGIEGYIRNGQITTVYFSWRLKGQ